MNATNLAVEEAAVPLRAQRRHPKTFTEMLVSSIIGLIASLVLSIDAVVLAANPNADLNCNINAAISCGKVGLSWQASLLGFPNAFLGLIAEPVVITIAVAALGGVRFPRWFLNSAQVVYLIGFLFAYWLFYQAYFVIGALCPWCLLITITTTTVFVSLLRVNILDNNLGLPPKLHESLSIGLRAGADTMGVLIIFAILAGLIFVKYGSVIFGG
jgi:uncharacterized membrane protein